MKKPTKPCYACGSNDWVLTPDGRYLCGKCHPSPNPSSEPAPPTVGEQYAPEVLVLRDRVILGNKKLNDAWEQIREMVHDTEEWNEQVERWHQANETLSALCTQLKVMGYLDCLYLDSNGKKTVKCLEQDDIGCRVCPSAIKYWEKEFSEL